MIFKTTKKPDDDRERVCVRSEYIVVDGGVVS